jgi:hypothetical protein
MSILGRFRSAANDARSDDTVSDSEVEAFCSDAGVNKNYGAVYAVEESSGSSSDHMLPSQDAQAGVRKIEAVTLTWTKSSLALLLIK